MSFQGQVRQQPHGSSHVKILAERIDPRTGEYINSAGFQAASAECQLPITGRGVVVTKDPDQRLIVDHSFENHQRVRIYDSQGNLIHAMTFANGTVGLANGPVIDR